MSNFAERFIQEGLAQGLEQGLERGEQRGEATMLLRLLHLKFGELPEAVRRRIEDADAQTLLSWSDRVLTAETIDEVISGG